MQSLQTNLTLDPTQTKYVSILTGSPGIQKTLSVLRYARKSSLKVALLYSSHELIDEIGEFFPPEFVCHWKGFTRLCPRYAEDEFIQELYELGIRTKVICNICGKRGCIYKKQFRTKKPIITAPKEYLKTAYLSKAKTQTVFVDEICLKYERIPQPDVKNINRFIRVATIAFDLRPYHDTYQFLDDIEKVRSFVERAIVKNYKYKENHHYVRTGSWGNISNYIRDLCSINLSKLAEWKRLYDCYGLNRDYIIPYLFDAFDRFHGNKFHEALPITLIDATPSLEFLRDMAKRYQNETGFETPLRLVDIGQITNKDSKVFRIATKKHPDAWYPKGSHFNPDIKMKMNELLELHQNEDVGVVTFKDFKEAYALNENVLTFGKLRSSNILMSCDAIFVVGSYNLPPDELTQLYRDFYVSDTMPVAHKTVEGNYEYENGKVENFRRLLETDEMYHAIHRCRPLQNRRTIYVFGIVPEKAKSELTYDLITDVPNFVRSTRILGGIHFYGGIDVKRFITKAEGQILFNDLVDRVRAYYGGIGENKVRNLLKKHPDLRFASLKQGKQRPFKLVSLK